MHLICENFYEDPDKIRSEALAAKYAPVQTVKLYPGQATKDTFLKPEITEKIEKLLGKKLRGSSNTGHSGRYRIAYKTSPYDRLVHYDGADVAGICFLTPNHISKNPVGTILYRHLESNTTKGHGSGVDYHPITFDLSRWEKVLECQDIYNRLFLFDPKQWHSIGNIYGNTILNGRLIQTFFYFEDKCSNEISKESSSGT